MIINGGEVLSSTEGLGQGGEVLITTRDLFLNDGGSIAVGSTGQGDAGSIQITATHTLRSENSTMMTESDQARGGNITLEARQVFLLDSEVTAGAKGAEPGTSDGGNVIVQSEQVVFNRSVIQANAFGGSGGNIGIDATEVYLASPDTILNASSALGLPGTVEISSPVIDLTDAVAPLSSNFDAAATLLSSRCVVRPRGAKSLSLIVRGRDRVPAVPDGVLPSPSGKPGVASATQPAWPGIGLLRKRQPSLSPVRTSLMRDCVH